MTKVILRAEGISKWYGSVAGIIDITVELPPGVTGLLGPNGAGKSTFLKLITGQLRPSRGHLEVLGQRPWNHPHIYTRLGYCPEQNAYYEAMTGRRFVATMAQLSGASDARAAAAEALETVGLTEQADRPIRAYSKGMRQRIKIAQAIAHHPELLVLDEPLNGLDPLGRRQIIEMVKRLSNQGVSILCSSHILHEVEAMTNSILLLHQGRLLASGDIHELRALMDEHPHNIEIECSEPRRLAKLLLNQPHVQSIRLHGDEKVVTVESTQPDRFYTDFPKLVLDESIDVQSLYSPDDNLDALFRYLVKG